MNSAPSLTEQAKVAIRAIHGAKIETWVARPWASVTFSGRRIFAELTFPSVAAGEAFVADFPEHEFALRSGLVADAAIVSVRAEPDFRVGAELLILDEQS